MKKIILTGANGMLGTVIKSTLSTQELYAFSSKELDITCTQQLQNCVARIKPDYIINCAAYTAVDLAETEQQKAYRINALAVEKLSQIADDHNATLIHFSTDYVFNGKATIPYTRTHHTDPINVYGASKFIGEQSITRINAKYYIFRISWLYAPHGKNFFRFIATTDHADLTIVDSQTGSPTSALDVADFINHLIQTDPQSYGIYHFTNQGACTWYAFAKAITEKLNLNKNILPVQDYPTAASRPDYSVMDCSETEQVFNYKIPSIENALDKVIELYERS